MVMTPHPISHLQRGWEEASASAEPQEDPL